MGLDEDKPPKGDPASAGHSTVSDEKENGALIEKYEAIVKSGDADPDVWAKLGDAYAGSGTYDKAIKCYDKALIIGPEKQDEVPILKSLAGSYAKVANFEKELETYNALLKKAPEDSSIWGNAARAFEKSGKTQEAVIHYTRALKLSKDDPMVLYHYSFFCEKIGQTDNAITVLKKTLELKPGSERVLERLSILCSKVQDYDSGTDYRMKLLELNEDDVSRWEDVVQILRTAKKLRGAMKVCQQGLEKFKSKNPSLWELLGDIYTDLYRFDNALHCYNEAAKLGNETAITKAGALIAKKVTPREDLSA